MKQKHISVVVPVYNEEENIEHFYHALKEVMEELPYAWELLFIDDSSSDSSQEILSRLAMSDARVRAIFLAHNSGHQIALACGMDKAEGEAVITMDGDMQHPPAILPKLLSLWEEGYEVVQTIRETTENISFLKHITSQLYYKGLNLISDVPVAPGGSDFRLLDRKVVLALRRHRERARFLRGLVASLGFRRTEISFVAPDRFAGVSKFSPKKMLNLAVNGVMAHSTLPLQIGLYMGVASASASILILAHVLLSKYLFDDAIPGWATITVLILFFGGIQLITLGLIGAYIGRIFEEVKKRPLYLITRDTKEDGISSFQ